MVVSSYFKKHRGFAIGITSVGGCVSTFIAPVASNYLLENYGYIGAAVISGAFVLNHCVGASLYQPVKWHMKPAKTCLLPEKPSNWNKESEETNLQEKVQLKPCNKAQTSKSENQNENDNYKTTLRNQEPANKFIKVLQSTYNNLKSLKYMRVHLISWVYFVFMFGLTNFLMWVPFVMTSKGFSLETAAWCSSLSSFGNLIGRILMSLLADRKFFNVIYGLMFGEVLMGFSIIGKI